MPAPKKRYCLRGHDTLEAGRNSQRRCRACDREKRHEYIKTDRAREIARKQRAAWNATDRGMVSYIRRYMNRLNKQADEGLARWEQEFGTAD